MASPTDILFSDFKTNLTPHPVTGDLAKNTNSEAIKRAIKNLILTNFYERPFRKNIGSDLRRHLFELFDDFTAMNIKDAIVQTLNNCEPRADVIDVRVTASPDQNTLDVTIVFTPINTIAQETVELELERIR